MKRRALLETLARAIVATCAFGVAQAVLGQDRPVPLDVANLEASASAEAAPDLAVVVLAVLREGSDSAALTQEIEQLLAHALAEAKAVSTVQAASGGFSTSPRFDGRGNRTGWRLRAEIILRSRDFSALGKLVGKLSAPADGPQIASSRFEVSPELRQSEDADLIEHALTNFKARAAQVSKALGYAGYTVRDITVGPTQVQGGLHPVMMRAAPASSAAPELPLESGLVTLQLEVRGSVQMHR